MIKIGNKKISFDLSTRKRLRISSKHGQVSVYDMNATSNSPILQFSMDASPADVGEVVRIKSTGIGNDIHAIALVENGNKGNFYYRINRDGQWIDMGKIFSKDGDYGNFDLLAIGSDLFIVFEIAASGRGEIGAARLSSGGWTRPLRITSAIGESKNPRITVDDLDGIHLVWEDDRNGLNQVMYAYQAGASYEWNSSAFGGNDIALTSPSVDSKNPSIAYADGKIFVGDFEFNRMKSFGDNVRSTDDK
jgi:outer membrane protein assembly factor BamB